MLSNAESHLWLRFLAVERMQHYHNQLRYKPDRTFFHLELHGSVLDNVQELKEALIQCSCLESIFLDDFHCDIPTWIILQECLQILAMKKYASASSATGTPNGGHQRYFKVQLRRIHILVEDHDESVLGGDTNDSVLLHKDTSGVNLARGLSQLSHYLSELHIIDCDIPSYGAQVLFPTTMTNKKNNNNNNTIKTLSDKNGERIQSPLQLLSLEGNTAIGNVGMRFLAEALTTNYLGNLQTLSVERVGASHEGLCTLFEAIRHHPNLTCLNIMGNVMDHPTLQYLLDVLIHDNTILQRIQRDRFVTTNKTPTIVPSSVSISSSLSSSLSTPSSACTGAALPAVLVNQFSSSIEFWLKVNRAGRRWIVQDSESWSLPSALWPWILQRFTHHDPDVLYYVLRSRPEFCSCSSPHHPIPTPVFLQEQNIS